MQLRPMSTPRKRQPLAFADKFVDKSERQRLDWRADRNFRGNAIERPLEKQAEGEQRLRSDAFEFQPSAGGGQDRVRKQYRALCRQMVHEQPSVEIVSAYDVKKAKGKARQPWTTMSYREGHRRRLVGHDEIWHMPVEVESAQTLLGQETGDHHDAQHHRQQQIEEIVAGVDGCHADADREQQEACAFRRQSERPAGGQKPELVSETGGAQVPEAVHRRPDHGRIQTGTGIVSTMSRRTRSACSKLCIRMPCARLSITRCDRTMGASSFTSSGRQKSRPRRSAKALAALLRARAPLVLTPRDKSSLCLVA